MQPEPFLNHKITEPGENLSRGVHFSAACYYYCVIKREFHKRDNPRVVGAELERWFDGVWQSTRDYAAPRVPGEPRGRSWDGILETGNPTLPARAEGEKRLRSATRNP